MSDAFQQVGSTYLMHATTTSDQPIQISASLKDANQYRIFNTGSVMVFVTFGQNQITTYNLAGIPDINDPQFATPIAPGSIEIFSGPDSTWVSIYTEAGEADVYVTPGRGI